MSPVEGADLRNMTLSQRREFVDDILRKLNVNTARARERPPLSTVPRQYAVREQEQEDSDADLSLPF